VKQNTEADPSSMMAENSHLISKMPERETGLPNTYLFEDVHSSGLVTRRVHLKGFKRIRPFSFP